MSTDPSMLDALRIDREHVPERRPSVWLIVTILAIAAIAVIVSAWLTRAKPVQVRTAAVREATAGTAPTLLNASGYVTARRAATVSSKVTGKVVEVMVEEGMKVEAGGELARIDASNVEKSARLAEAQLEATRRAVGETTAALEQAERELKRARQLLAGKVATQAEFDEADAEAKTQRARLERQMADIAVAESEVAVWRQQLEDTIIRAPFSGIVTSKDSQPGEMISPVSAGGGFTRTGICTIVDMSSLEIEVDVNESHINRVSPDQPVEATLDSYPTWRIPAKVIAIIPTADRQKATVKVRVGFQELDPRILPDMSVKVAFQGARGGATAGRTLTVPAGAVSKRDGRDVVWIVQSDGKVERRAVTVSSAGAAEAVIAGGVSSGERVVVDPPAGLRDGDRVTEGKS